MDKMEKLIKTDNLIKIENLIEQDEMEISIEEFSIAELEDRLEFSNRSNGNCKPV